MKPPYFLYAVLPERWADWCCERPENLTMVFSGASIALVALAVFR